MGQGSHAGWVLGVLARHLRPGDNAPELLRRLASDVAVDEGHVLALLGSDIAELDHSQPIVSPDAPATSPVLWTRRHAQRGRPYRRPTDLI